MQSKEVNNFKFISSRRNNKSNIKIKFNYVLFIETLYFK